MPEQARSKDVNPLRRKLAERWEWLIAVKADDQEQARLGRLFNILMMISTGVVVALSSVFLLMQPLGLLGPKVSWVAAAFPLAFIPLSLFCLVRSRRGSVLPMVRLYVWINLIAISIAIWLFDGVYSPGWMLYIWTISTAGILLAPVYALWMTAGVLGYFLLLWLLSRFGFYTPLFTFSPGREFLDIAML
ncbi:MAG: hypothetical protein PHE55_13990, partial [Methylococcaceae bacterium]|nr:hypothetical protein [Methylococcaceae bacterium]